MAVTLNVLPPCCMIPLRALTQVAPDALITGATYFFPFFVGKYGPSVAPMETEVLVRVSANLDDLRARLEEAQPEVRWKVRTVGATPCPDGDKGIEDALQDAPIVALCGGVRLENGVPTYHFGHQDALRHLRDGLLVPNSGDISGSRELAADLLSQFPGLRADFISYSGKTLHETYEDIHQAVQQNEYGGRMKKSSFLPVEQKWIEAIRQWHRMSTPAVQMVPAPRRASLPTGDPWSAGDSEFREWLINQALVRMPQLRPDPYLHRMLDMQKGEQKTTHQGWETYRHALMTMLVLETDRLDAADRRAMRVAALLHDIGKLYNIWTPGCHAQVGAKQWRRYAPDWLTEAEVELVTFLIRNHDMLGLMDRGIVSDEYRGGVSPTDVREALAAIRRPAPEALILASAIYQADIGSVAALRWLLPLTPLLEGVVRAGISN